MIRERQKEMMRLGSYILFKRFRMYPYTIFNFFYLTAGNTKITKINEKSITWNDTQNNKKDIYM